MKTTLIILCSLFIIYSCSNKNNETLFANSEIAVLIDHSQKSLWKYKILPNGKTISYNSPVFEIDGKSIQAKLKNIKLQKPVILRNGVTEYIAEGDFEEIPEMKLKLIFRVSQSNPVVRFCYVLESDGTHKLTKSKQHDNVSYLGTSLKDFNNIKEIRFSEFNEMVHSFCLSERSIGADQIKDSLSFMGPMITATNDKHAFLLAYEHGSQVPDRFLEFSLTPESAVNLKAVKGNYVQNYTLNKNNSFRTVWFETAAIVGNEDALAKNYRDFMLNYMSENLESRKPYIFYNTWNFQERNKHWYKKPYLGDMTMERMLREIEVAHKMGIEVFVIDAGWFEKTGDWTPSLKRFPDGLKQVKAKLTEYGMKLGLWFNPTVAAVSSNMYNNNLNYVRTMNGDKGKPWPIWETEESYGMCLVSPYRDAFADKLIQLNKELGVTYFKWDAIGQYECNDPRHFHGDSTNTQQDRLENYAFEIGRSMSYVVDKLSKACPEAIVDFDITEGGRTVGLGFLSSGKYFLINNGPYYFNYDIPFDRDKDNWNMFFYPGPARGWICRTPLTFDKWIPSVLFLTHYLPDDPYENQSIAVGSLILGQNGIWGDLPNISDEGVSFFNKTLGLYKQVRNDMAATSMIRDGAVGGSPEIYEKINPVTGKGAVVIFSSHAGNYNYTTQNKVLQNHWETAATSVLIGSDGKARIKAEFKTAEAKIIFFGIKN